MGRQQGIDQRARLGQRKQREMIVLPRQVGKTKEREMTPFQRKRQQIKLSKTKRKKAHNTIPGRLRHQKQSRAGSTGNEKHKW